jgi:hypothetical protein
MKIHGGGDTPVAGPKLVGDKSVAPTAALAGNFQSSRLGGEGGQRFNNFLRSMFSW